MSFLGLVGLASLESVLFPAQHLPDALKSSLPIAFTHRSIPKHASDVFLSLSEFRFDSRPQSAYLSSHLRLLASTLSPSSQAHDPLGLSVAFSSQLTAQSHQWLKTANKAFSHSAEAIAANATLSNSVPGSHLPLDQESSQPAKLSEFRSVTPQWLGFLKKMTHWGQEIQKTTQGAWADVKIVQAEAHRTSASTLNTTQQSEQTFWQCDWLQATRSLSRSKPDSPGFQVWVRGQLILEVTQRQKAQLIAQRLQSLLSHSATLDPSTLQPGMMGYLPVGQAGNSLLFVVDKQTAAELHRSPDLLAIEWINNLRVALGAAPLDVVEAQAAMYDLIETRDRVEGIASWYGPFFHGRATATGETFDQNDLTAAHPSLPFDTYLKVTNLESGDSVIVRINDRGPYVDNRSLDLSREAARCLNSEEVGIIPYTAVIMKPAVQTPSSEQTLARQL